MAETSTIPPSVKRLSLIANIAALVMLLQLVLGVMIAFGTGGSFIREAHAGVAYLTILAGIVAAVLAWPASKVAGSKGIFFHALSLPILAIIQMGLGEMHVTVVHIILGVLTVVAYVGLVPMANKIAERVAAPAA